MKKSKIVLLIVLFSSCFALQAQESTKENTEPDAEEEVSSIFRFEPDYLTSVETEKEAQKRNREILDTLSVSERKKKKLLKKMFTNDFSEYLTKKGLVDSKFEETEE